jgi:predicted HTH transcriptional regulator
MLNTRKDHILKVISDNPGINGRGVHRELSDLGSMRQITFSISDLRKEGLIENRGRSGNGSRWYIKEANADQ